MLGLLSALFEAVTQGLKLINSQNATKYRDKWVSLSLDLQKEMDKGDDSDDAKIESIIKEKAIIAQAARDELVSAASGKSGL